MDLKRESIEETPPSLVIRLEITVEIASVMGTRHQTPGYFTANNPGLVGYVTLVFVLAEKNRLETERMSID